MNVVRDSPATEALGDKGQIIEPAFPLVFVEFTRSKHRRVRHSAFITLKKKQYLDHALTQITLNDYLLDDLFVYLL